MGYNWDFHMIFAGYEAWWLKGFLITIAYASATVTVSELLAGRTRGTPVRLTARGRAGNLAAMFPPTFYGVR